MPRFATRLVAALALALTVAVVRPALASDDPTMTAFSGSWSYVSGQEARDSAIEVIVARLPGPLRGTVREMIAGGLPVPRLVEVEITSEICRVGIGTEAIEPVITDLEGTPLRWTRDGEETQVERTRSGAAIEEVGMRGPATRSAVYRLNGDQLVVDVVLRHDLMPGELAFRLTYQRRS